MPYLLISWLLNPAFPSWMYAWIPCSIQVGSGAQASVYGVGSVCPSSCSWNWASAWFLLDSFFFFFFACLKNPLDFWEGCGQLCIPPAHLEQELFPEALGGASEKSILTDKCSRLLLLRFWGAPDQRLHSDQCLMANDQTYPPCTHPIHFQLTYPLGLHHISSKLIQFNHSFCGKTSFFFFFSHLQPFDHFMPSVLFLWDIMSGRSLFNISKEVMVLLTLSFHLCFLFHHDCYLFQNISIQIHEKQKT